MVEDQSVSYYRSDCTYITRHKQDPLMLNDTHAPKHGKEQETPAQMSGKGKGSVSLKKNKKKKIPSTVPEFFKQQGMIIGLFIFPSLWLLGLLRWSGLMATYFI